MSDCEGIAQVAHDKRATVSDLLRSLMTKERRVRFTLFHERNTLSLFYYFAHKNKRIARKANHLKNQYANSQDCRKPGLYSVTVSNCSDNSVMWRSVRCHCVWFLILTLLNIREKVEICKEKEKQSTKFWVTKCHKSCRKKCARA